VLSVTIANGELFRVYPGDRPGRSTTVHQNSTPLDLSDESAGAGAQAVFEYAHATVRDEDYRLSRHCKPTSSPASRTSGVRTQRTRLQHRHITWLPQSKMRPRIAVNCRLNLFSESVAMSMLQ